MSAYRVKPGEEFHIYSMGKRLRVIAFALSDEEANAYMAANDEAAVVACFGPLVLLANRHDKGTKEAATA